MRRDSMRTSSQQPETPIRRPPQRLGRTKRLAQPLRLTRPMQTIRGIAFAATLAAGGWIAGGWIDGGWIDDGWIGGGWIAGDSVTRDSVTGSWIVGFPTAVAVAAPPVVGDDSSGDSSIAAPTAAPTAASNTAPFGPVVGEDLESRRERVRQM
ncbi:MAG: hypothetical protein ACKO38_11065 [Planctomycetota bacterium]